MIIIILIIIVIIIIKALFYSGKLKTMAYTKNQPKIIVGYTVKQR